MNRELVIHTLKDLSGWLVGSKDNQQEIEKIITLLEHAVISDAELAQLKTQLSTEMLFHPKWLGDSYIPQFIGDGTPYAWQNYLAEVARICQEHL